MLCLSFDTKSMFRIRMPKYYLLLCSPTLLAFQYPVNKMFCITSQRYGDNANGTDLTTYLN